MAKFTVKSNCCKIGFALLIALLLPQCVKDTIRTDSSVRGVARTNSQSEEIRYLSLGDSFTAGTGSSPQQAFPVRLTERLIRSGRRVVLENPAVNGYTTRNLIARELGVVSSFSPTLVTVAIGANDIVRGSTEDEYRANLRVIFNYLGNGRVPAHRVYALPQPDWSQSEVGAQFGDPQTIAEKIQRFNQILQEEVTRFGGHFVALFPLMLRQAQSRMIAQDGLHPSAEAYDQWAEVVFQSLSD